MRYTLLCLWFISEIATAESIKIGGRSIHAQIQGPEKAPSLVLLSGPTDHWHSDSAWWALALQELSQDYRVIAIDRPGQGMSDPVPQPSYRSFATDLHEVLQKQNIRDAVVIGFASANLAIFQYLLDHAQDKRIRGLILIDPDVLTAYSIYRYQKDAQPFKDKAAQYQKLIESGGRLLRTREVNKKEKEEIQALVAATGKKLDWTYFDSVLAAREKIPNQKALFAEIAAYGDDLAPWLQQKAPTSVPLVIVDSAFETSFIKADTPKSEADELRTWAKDGENWYRSLVKATPLSHYVAYPEASHVKGCFDIDSLRKWLLLLPGKS